MNFTKFVLSTVKNRVDSLEGEIDIMEKQLENFKTAPGITDNDRLQLSLQRNIKATLHDLLITYILTMEKISPPISPLMQVISCHIFTLQQNEIVILLQELYGQQSALTTLVGQDYMRFTNDDDIPADVHLKMISLVFPWEFVFELLKDAGFLKTLVKTILKYNPKYHKQAVTVIFNSIAKFQALPYLESSIHFFTAKTPMYFALAEHLVTLFAHTIMINDGIDPLLNFSIAEKCALISQNCMQICELNPKYVTILQKASLEKQKSQANGKDDIFIRPYITKEQFKQMREEQKNLEAQNAKQHQTDSKIKQQIDSKLKQISANQSTSSQFSSESSFKSSEISCNKTDLCNEKHFQNDPSLGLTENIELPELSHIILELRKIPLQLSPTSMLFCLSNALQYLKSALASDGKLIGADESFEFFAYCLSMAKLRCLPAIITFIDKFVDEALQETQFNYFIEQLRAGYQFIDNRWLPVQPFLLFPFPEPPLHLRGILNRVKKTNKADENKQHKIAIHNSTELANSNQPSTEIPNTNQSNSTELANSSQPSTEIPNTNQPNSIELTNANQSNSTELANSNQLNSTEISNANQSNSTELANSNQPSTEIPNTNQPNSIELTNANQPNSTESNLNSTDLNQSNSNEIDSSNHDNSTDILTNTNEVQLDSIGTSQSTEFTSQSNQTNSITSETNAQDSADINQNSNDKAVSGSSSQTIPYDPLAENADPIFLEGFEIFAFPTWTQEYSTLFPAMIRYTGGESSAICYQYNVSSITAHSFFHEKFEDIPTLYGTFFQLTDELIKSAFMIRIESNDYEKCLDNVEAFSAMILMSDTKIPSPRISMMNDIYQRVKKEWSFTIDNSSLAIKTAVAEVQRALVILEYLPNSFFIDGVLNIETLTAMRKFLKPKKNKLLITPRVFNYIISSAD